MTPEQIAHIRALLKAANAARHKTGIENHAIVAKFEKHITDKLPALLDQLEAAEKLRVAIGRHAMTDNPAADGWYAPRVVSALAAYDAKKAGG